MVTSWTSENKIYPLQVQG